MPDQPTLLFVHIPKTAGTSVSLALKRCFDPDEVFHIRSDQHEKAPRFSRHCGSEEHFRALPDGVRARFRCVLGHMKFGLHEAIPRPAEYFTVLRNPLDRYYSQVAQYNRMARAGELPPGSKPVSPMGFRDVKHRQFTNPQTRWVAGLSNSQIDQTSPAHALAMARRNIDRHFRAVGVAERLERSMHQLAHRSGWRTVNVGRENASPCGTQLAPFDEAQLADFIRHNRLDYELWNEARQRIEASQIAEGIGRDSTERGLMQLLARAFARSWRRSDA